MGLGILGGRSSCSCNKTTDRVVEKIVEKRVVVQALPNPDPNRFKVIKYQEVGAYLIVLVNYPDCTNYEGNKIMFYKTTYKEFSRKYRIDPHFCENCFSPIARFKPDDEGWQMALLLAHALSLSNEE